MVLAWCWRGSNVVLLRRWHGTGVVLMWEQIFQDFSVWKPDVLSEESWETGRWD